MDYLIQMIKKVGFKIIPFFQTTVLYFVLGTYELQNRNKLWSTAVKILPIIALMAFTLLHGIKNSCSRKQLLIGLVFSSIGDILLNMDLFPQGMGAFAIAQVFYIKSFGFKPLKPMIGIGLYALAVICISLFYNNLPAILQIGLPVYAFLLLTMCWRALARVERPSNLNKLPYFLCAIGAVLFVISDSLIAFDKFYIPLKSAPFLIMITYYVAQFGIVMSMVELDETQHTKSNSTKIKNGQRKQKAQ